MAIPVIYKGDDTDFRGSTGFTLKVVTSSNLNLSGCAVEVEVLGFRRSFPASATGELVCPFAFTAAETQRMPLGIHAATVRVYDSKGRVRTINNSIRVKVTNSVHEAYGKDDPQEVTLAVSTVDLEAYAKKAEVTAAITAALKDAGASVKLHALTPEVTDTTVTLKPVDGAANYVEGKVEAQPKVTRRSFSTECRFWAEYSCPLDGDDEELLHVSFYFPINSSNSVVERIYGQSGDWVADIVTTDDIPSTVNEDEHRELFEGVEIPKGMKLEAYVQEIITEGDCTDISQCSFKAEYCYFPTDFDPILPEAVTVGGLDYGLVFTENGDTGFLHNVHRNDVTVAVTLPTSTDTTKARRFSLATETDVDSEKAVEWQGGEVVEALPGASKLVPGLNVWDVSEVAPGKFRVERASNPAQSVPLTLTAPGGRVAELTVGDDLVLEVKEK